MIKFIASAIAGFTLVALIGFFAINNFTKDIHEVGNSTIVEAEVTPSVLGSPNDSKTKRYEIDYEDMNLRALVYKIDDPAYLTLNSNLGEKQTASFLMKENSCSFLVNAAFYTKEDTHVGLFINDHIETTRENVNSLFDGFLTINSLDVARITENLPDDPLRNAIQTGPIFKSNGFSHDLTIRNDKLARRVFAAVDGNNELYFVIVYDPKSTYQGPMLADMPSIVEDVEDESGIIFADAINLDGGSASTFMSENYSISELSPIGSYYCYKN